MARREPVRFLTESLGRSAAVGCRGEVNGSVDLISLFNLSAQYDYFCQNPLPSISKSHYLDDMPEITNEDGNQRWRLKDLTGEKETVEIQPFDADLLREAFQFKEAAPSEKGKEKEHKHRHHHKEHKHRHHHHHENENEKKRKHDGEDEGIVGEINKRPKFKIKRSTQIAN